jgi:hypothetical protein
MLGSDLLVAPLTDENAFAEVYLVALTEADQVTVDPGVQMALRDGVLSLDIAGTNAGLPGARIEFSLKAGPCVAWLAARGDIGLMDLRLRRVETDREVDVGEMYKDDVRVEPEAWGEQVYGFTVPADGQYRFYVGKGYYQQLSEPKRLELRNVAFEQRRGGPGPAWKREVYLPAGVWRDFWTGAPVEGGRQYEATATPEHPPVFVRNNTLLPLAEPMLTLDARTVFTVHLAAYGETPRSCELLEDDGVSLDFEKGRWATLTVGADGAVQRPEHGQPTRYRVAGPAAAPQTLLRKLLETADGK